MRFKRKVFASLCSIIFLFFLYISTITHETGYKGLLHDDTDGQIEQQKHSRNGAAVKLISKKDGEERFERRAEYTKRTCERFKGMLDKSKQKVRCLLYLEQHKILFCPIEKTASSFWKKILFAVSHPDEVKDAFEVGFNKAYSNTKYKKITEKDSLSNIVNDSVSFMFVRDPFTRLFSGWLDKFKAVNTAYWNFGKQIIAEERINARLKSLNCGHDVAFKELVNFVSKRIISGKSVDGHFSPSVEHCNPCELNVTYIGKYETLEEDTQYIVDQFRNASKINIERNFRKKSVLDMIQDSADFFYSQKKALKYCMSTQCGMFRVWKRLTVRGIISKNLLFPFSNPERAENVSKDGFIAALIDAHEKSDPNEIVNNRREALEEAYQSLGKESLSQMLRAFEMDFDLFGYPRKPSFLESLNHVSSLDKKYKNEFSYLKDCPY